MQKPILKADRKAKPKQSHSRPGFVYLMFDPKVKLTKIGLSRCPKRRRYYLSREYQSELKILAIAPTINMKFTEDLMHQIFSSDHIYRTRGLDGFTEWFELGVFKVLVAQVSLFGIVTLLNLGCLAGLALILVLIPMVLSW